MLEKNKFFPDFRFKRSFKCWKEEMRLTIDITEDEEKILKKRGKRNFLKLKEQVEDIIRRSCITSKNISYPKTKVDDNLVDIFSREKRGRRRK